MQSPLPQSPCWLPESVSKWCIKFSEERRKRKICETCYLLQYFQGEGVLATVWGQGQKRNCLIFLDSQPSVSILTPSVEWGLVGSSGGGKMLNPSCLLIFVWVSLCRPGCPETWDPPASVSLVLTLQACLVVWTRFWRWEKIETDGRVEDSFYLRMSASSLGGQVFSCGGFGSS